MFSLFSEGTLPFSFLGSTCILVPVNKANPYCHMPLCLFNDIVGDLFHSSSPKTSFVFVIMPEEEQPKVSCIIILRGLPPPFTAVFSSLV